MPSTPPTSHFPSSPGIDADIQTRIDPVSYSTHKTRPKRGRESLVCLWKTPLLIKMNLKTTLPLSDPYQKGFLSIPKTRF